MVTLLALFGITGIASTMGINRSYTTKLQVISVLTGVICCYSATWYDRRCYAPRSYSCLSNCSIHRSSSVHMLLFFGLVVPLWVAFIILNGRDSRIRTESQKGLVFDHAYSPPMPMEVVISMYGESTAYVAALVSDLRSTPKINNAYFHVYTKLVAANTNEFQIHTNADRVTKIPNIGRESETYLYHIQHEYDKLAKHTMFIQAGVHNRREFFSRIHYYFESNLTGMLSLGAPGTLCSCHGCRDYRIYGSMACSYVHLCYKGQFIVSAQRIKGISKTIYDELRDAFVKPASWAHQHALVHGREDSISKPDLGYTMERLWNLLFRC
ncbi:hypothetical protein BKA66DRAFT_517378 [Pyrenochaeta sp. MPI-SDFR-AT-0127]|nr:hypothetical protein BKA66DRAFT_517378 [Pyrenochaeta sp. MPI-SDFR-AT-0127]